MFDINDNTKEKLKYVKEKEIRIKNIWGITLQIIGMLLIPSIIVAALCFLCTDSAVQKRENRKTAHIQEIYQKMGYDDTLDQKKIETIKFCMEFNHYNAPRKKCYCRDEDIVRCIKNVIKGGWIYDGDEIFRG